MYFAICCIDPAIHSSVLNFMYTMFKEKKSTCFYYNFESCSQIFIKFDK